MMRKYTTANIAKASSFTFFSTTTPTRASVTVAKAVSKKKYVPSESPVPKYCDVIDQNTAVALDAPPSKNPGP